MPYKITVSCLKINQLGISIKNRLIKIFLFHFNYIDCKFRIQLSTNKQCKSTCNYFAHCYNYYKI